MMHGSGEQYMRGDGYSALSLPYISDAVRVLFILPDEGQLEAIERELGAELFDETRQALARHSVDVKIPRFKFETEIPLKGALSALGMSRAFGAADLSGISGAPGELYIDEVYHKAFVAMDEEGTEAAAATAVVVREVSLPPPAEFFCDRPFLFFIYDDPTGQILFAGRVAQPGS
jgi:serpin B